MYVCVVCDAWNYKTKFTMQLGREPSKTKNSLAIVSVAAKPKIVPVMDLDSATYRSQIVCMISAHSVCGEPVENA